MLSRLHAHPSVEFGILSPISHAGIPWIGFREHLFRNRYWMLSGASNMLEVFSTYNIVLYSIDLGVQKAKLNHAIVASCLFVN